METRCEKCGARAPRKNAGPFSLFDYCAVCSANLCDECMAKGHCGHIPARSGDAEGMGEESWAEAHRDDPA